MGTPDFSIPSLKSLLESKHEVVAVVTTPDKERGRGQKISFTPVKEFALKNNLNILVAKIDPAIAASDLRREEAKFDQIFY